MPSFIQFQLWRDCKNNCNFCWQKGMPESNKEIMLDFTLRKIESLKESEYDEVGLIGGEFFSGQISESIEIHDKFFKIIDACFEKKFQKFYLTTSLIFKNLNSLFETIDYFSSKNKLNILLLCTSYDTIYRFHNENAENLWKNNMNILHKKYPSLKIHTEIILSQDFILRVINDEFDLEKFQKEFNTSVDFIQTQCNEANMSKDEINNILPNFIPKRNDFLKFLKKTCIDNTVDLKNLLNKNLHSSIFYTENNKKIIEISDRRTRWEEVGISGYKKIGRNFFDLNYIDSEKSIESDISKFKKLKENLCFIQ